MDKTIILELIRITFSTIFFLMERAGLTEEERDEMYEEERRKFYERPSDELPDV